MPRTPSGDKPGRRPHLPFKLLVTLLYGHVPGVRRMGSGRMLVTVRDLANYLRTSGFDLKCRFKKLEDWGLFEKMEMDKHTVLVTVRPPIDWAERLDD